MTSKETIVRKQLGAIIALTELASLLLLFTLIHQDFMPGRMETLLVLLLPIVFGLHVIEEFVLPGGFIRWDNIYRPQFTDTPGSFYVRINTIPGVGSLLLALGSFDYNGHYSAVGIRAWLALLTFMTWNAVFHFRGAVQTRRYSPGMATGLLLFVPLAIISYVYLLSSGVVDGVSAGVCVVFALSVQPVLDYLKTHGKKAHV